MLSLFALHAWLVPGAGYGQPIPVPNASFEEGTADGPANWTLNAGTGGRMRENSTEGHWHAYVDGSPDYASYWESPEISLEPDSVYALRMDGFERLKRVAPHIERMLTEQVEDALASGPNLYCPMISTFQPARAAVRREEGDRSWWYVCTVPKEPYPGLFIDHPGVDMRVWLWMTWHYNLDGVLVWATNYWTSPGSFPDKPQNPYEDPMGWVSSKGPDIRSPWGNGDGRFFYPPLAAADASPPDPVIEPRVPAQRVAMLSDGIEDFEYLTMLARLIEESGETLSGAQRETMEGLLQVPDTIFTSRVDYNFDPTPPEERRAKIARGIEFLLQSAEQSESAVNE